MRCSAASAKRKHKRWKSSASRRMGNGSSGCWSSVVFFGIDQPSLLKPLVRCLRRSVCRFFQVFERKHVQFFVTLSRQQSEQVVELLIGHLPPPVTSSA